MGSAVAPEGRGQTGVLQLIETLEPSSGFHYPDAHTQHVDLLVTVKRGFSRALEDSCTRGPTRGPAHTRYAAAQYRATLV